MYEPDPENEQDEAEELLLEEEAADEVDGADPDADETLIVLEGEDADEAEEETPAIKRMRERIKELNRENRQLRGSATAPAPQIELGPEPTMEDDDVDWDQEKFKAKLSKWIADKAKHERQQEEAQTQAKKANEAWEAQLAAYERKKAALSVPGKEELEEEALSKLSQIKQAIIVKHPNNAAIMIALGKYPKKLAAVAAIEDPVDFAYAIADIGRELKVTARRKAPEPEGIVKGDARVAVGNESKRLAQLEREAERTGDRTQLLRFKKQMKAA
jgi:hypothetical protein